MAMKTPTPSAKTTEVQYSARTASLARQYELQTGNEWQADPLDFCRWAAGLRSNLKPNSWRLYKASLMWVLRREGLGEAADWLVAQGSEGCKPRLADLKTSQRKAKKLAPHEAQAIAEYLARSGRLWDELLADWLRCAVLTGLRPCEWQGATVEGDWLVVKNAKHTHGRACGESRYLDLSLLEPEEKTLMDALAKRLSCGDYPRIYLACRKRLASVAAKLWPGREKRPTLYSARHQFAADAKFSGLSKEEVAACMGHRSSETAGAHYGRRTAGRSPVRVAPSADNIAMVDGGEAKMTVLEGLR